MVQPTVPLTPAQVCTLLAILDRTGIMHRFFCEVPTDKPEYHRHGLAGELLRQSPFPLTYDTAWAVGDAWATAMEVR